MKFLCNILWHASDFSGRLNSEFVILKLDIDNFSTLTFLQNAMGNRIGYTVGI